MTGAASIEGIFDAKSVAVIGASSKPGNLAARIVRNLVLLEFPGPCYPIGRSEGEIHGLPVYKSVLDVPGPIDLAVIAIPAQLVPAALEECGQKGVRYATITSSGFGEFSADRRGLEEQMLATSERYGIRFLGPNCQGIRDFATGLSTRFGRQEKPEGLLNVAGVIVQSGTISSTFERFLKLDNIGLTRLASIGNKLNVDETDLLPAYLSHEPTRMVFLYLEGIRQGRKLIETARRATKPVVLLKGNISDSTATIARSHSASVLNDGRILEAAARQAGITLITQFSEAQIVAKAFLLPPMKGDNLVIFGGSGGMAVVGADWAHRTGFNLVGLPDATAHSIEGKLPGGYIKIGNPVDLGDFFDMKATLAMIDEVLALPAVDGMVVITFDPTPGDQFHNMADRPFAAEIKAIMERHGKPIGLVYATERDVLQRASAEASMPIFAGADEAVRGLDASRANWRKADRVAAQPVRPAMDEAAIRRILDDAKRNGRAALGYAESFALLAAAGIRGAMPKLVGTADEAWQAARPILPVALKLLPGDGGHKTELGGIRLGLGDEASVRAAFADIAAKHPNVPACVQPMLSGAELMLGAKQDPHFGAVISVGLGGTMVELLDDAALRIAPVTPDEAAGMLGESRAGRLLAGYRGAPARDTAAAVDALVRLGWLVESFPEIVEVDVNPLMALVRGQGVCAADARIFIKQ